MKEWRPANGATYTVTGAPVLNDTARGSSGLRSDRFVNATPLRGDSIEVCPDPGSHNANRW